MKKSRLILNQKDIGEMMMKFCWLGIFSTVCALLQHPKLLQVVYATLMVCLLGSHVNHLLVSLSPHSISLAGRKPAESWLKAG